MRHYTTHKFVYITRNMRLYDIRSEMTYHTQHNPGFKRHIPKTLLPTIPYTCLIHRAGTENRFKPSALVYFIFSTTNPNPNNPTRISQKEKKTPTTLHHTTVYTQINHPTIYTYISYNTFSPSIQNNYVGDDIYYKIYSMSTNLNCDVKVHYVPVRCT